MAYPQKSSWGSFHNPQFNRLNSQIEQQTQALLRERQNLSSNIGNFQNIIKPVQSQNYVRQDFNTDRSNFSQKGNLSQKVKQLVQLCKNQNTTFGNQLLKIINEQRSIYEALNTGQQGQSSVQNKNLLNIYNPIMQAPKQSSVYQGSREQIGGSNTEVKSPLKSNTTKSALRQVIQKNPKFEVSDDLIQMIEQIQRKALNQIEKLREEKISLMKQLKTQIQSNNQLQKEINTLSQQMSRQQQSHRESNYTPYKMYQQQQNVGQRKNVLQEQLLNKIRTEMDNLRKQNQQLQNNLASQQTFGLTNQSSSSQQTFELRSRVVNLENEVRKRDQIISQLMNEVTQQQQQGYRSENSIQLAQLLEQGEAIRQSTLYLIRMKQAGGQRVSGSEQQLLNRIQQLQEMLERQQIEKQSFLNDLLAFKQKYQQLQEQNRNLKKTGSNTYGSSSNIPSFSPIYPKYTHNRVESQDQYSQVYRSRY